MRLRIGKREVGDGAPCFIVFEAGPTHTGVESAKRLSQLAREAGADAVKFQLTNPERIVSDRSQPFSYEVLVDRRTGETRTMTEPLYEVLKRRALSRDQWREVKQFCDSIGLVFFATAAFLDDLDFLLELGCETVKIASADINHFPLIQRAASSGLAVQVDTGNATIGEVESAVDAFLAAGGKHIIVHHCPSGYPARLESINLRIIRTLKAMFDFPIAFSDHTPGWEMDVAAIALGANLVEKTITFDRTTPSIEHMFSLEPDDMKRFVRIVREVETALGLPRKRLSTQELDSRKKIRRSAHLLRAVRKGEVVTSSMVEFRRPGFGITPDRFAEFEGMRFLRDIDAAAMLRPGDIGQP